MVHVLSGPGEHLTIPNDGHVHLVYGTTGNNQVTAVQGALAHLRHFPGKNTIHIQTDMGQCLVARSGAMVTIRNPNDGTRVKIPATTQEQTLVFDGISNPLQIIGGQVFLGDFQIDLTEKFLADDSSFARVENKGELVIGLDDSFPPMGFRLADGTLVGFDVDVAHELGKRLGLKIVWKPTAWSGVVHSLNAKMFDCIWNGMVITPERQEKLAFTKPYIMDGQIAVVRFKDNRFKTYKDLGNTVLGVQKYSSAMASIKKLPQKPAEVKEYADNPKAMLDLEAGIIDAVIVDNVTGRYSISQRIGKFKVLPGNISREPFGVAFRKSDKTLLNTVQETIDAMIADDTMAKISTKWFGEDITNPEKW